MTDYCAAHRGFSGIAPENTMAAVKLAMENTYVKWIEVDVQLSKDGVPFLIHDYTLNRTTSGRGPVKDALWDELSRLDAGSWKSPEYAGERLVTLDRFLEAVQGRLQVNLEIKTENDKYPGLEERMVAAVKKRGMEQDVVFTSFDTGALRKVKKIDPGMRTGLIIDGRPADLLERLKDLGSDFLSISYRYLTSEFASRAVQSGIEIMAWTIDDAKTMKRISEMHPEIMICTNRPDVWQDTFINGKVPKARFGFLKWGRK
ncbi:glycerophosphodiester phosphodiesterase family protein [Paenibacillus sp. J22TS3]|uniref:glycerophosphodiester phosphodiesterase n=1 Tax=Paenibacillus sp. J22TS3 TaxID=2807192 RepID=UPI001B0CC84C|nr:glycerophosphodiester phosphodiesterase family protein [Paenibacillus sp. J22TS3]GIP21201.1 glycerophosphoryl diester phosphodiesterase [Paenibacillus sp. J22TS3]